MGILLCLYVFFLFMFISNAPVILPLTVYHIYTLTVVLNSGGVKNRHSIVL